jgi:hypothetical protein
MAGGDAKIKIRVGEVEIEYEGDAAFLEKGLLDVCKQLSALNEQIPAAPIPPHKVHEDRGGVKSVGKLSTVTIANLLGSKTGPDLVIVAAAYLHFSEGKPEFTRGQILDAMKSATGYWEENYSKNLSTSLKNLTRTDKLRVVKDDTYSLPAKETTRLEAVLAKA